MKFYLGTHRPHWLGLLDIPLFVSRRVFLDKDKRQLRKTLPRALGRWALDSGGFTELKDNGHWSVEARQYAREVRRLKEEVGNLDFAAPMDWMCEPWIVAKTGGGIRIHQQLTVENYLELRELDDGLPFIPVLQGFTLDDYLYCAALYEEEYGIDLSAEPLVGLGSVCRRQNMSEAEVIVRRLKHEGINLHGFGVKITGLAWYGDALGSADSMAWSLKARKRARAGEPSCEPLVRKSCANCLHYAVEWRADLLARPAINHQLPMEEAA